MIGDKYSFWPLTLNSVTSVHQTQIQQRISEVSDSIKKENIELETITKELDSKVKKIDDLKQENKHPEENVQVLKSNIESSRVKIDELEKIKSNKQELSKLEKEKKN
ncbi:hypothetical protein V2P32_05140 [Mycoplasma sp. 06067-C1-B144P-99-0482-3]